MPNNGVLHHYEIGVRKFRQQILPGGVWNNFQTKCRWSFSSTPVFGYGPASDPMPDSSSLGGDKDVAPALNSRFNYPAYTIENIKHVRTTVYWKNQLVRDPVRCNWQNPKNDAACDFIPHLLPVDQTVHWAKPAKSLKCNTLSKTKDCTPDPNQVMLSMPYTGPVPIVTHVHGAHAEPESDGYPEAWFLPAAGNIDEHDYSITGTLVNKYGIGRRTNEPGVAKFRYRNDQPSSTIWYHDHTLGMTRSNVYAGMAGFWLIRQLHGETGLVYGRLPEPAPKAGEDLKQTNLAPGRGRYREIPMAIQDRSFNDDGTLFYPGNRSFYELPDILHIPFIPDPKSDISPIWGPEFFGNVMLVNGVAWPFFEVQRDLYRFRLLNGCNSRFLNLALVRNDTGREIPFYQIGGDQGMLPKVVMVMTGNKTQLPGDGHIPSATSTKDPYEALLMGTGQRADVLVDFTELPVGTEVLMVNTAPDGPFTGGIDPGNQADQDTTRQVMKFIVVGGEQARRATPPALLRLWLPDWWSPANLNLEPKTIRNQALLERASDKICITTNGGTTTNGDTITSTECDTQSQRFSPKNVLLGFNGDTTPVVTFWADAIVTNPETYTTEIWLLWNWTPDAHTIHLHLVKFKILYRQEFDKTVGRPTLRGPRLPPSLTETGWADTAIAPPGQVTSIKATFDIPGLYAWHCHLLEHEDNEMMVPYCVGDRRTAPGCNVQRLEALADSF